LWFDKIVAQNQYHLKRIEYGDEFLEAVSLPGAPAARLHEDISILLNAERRPQGFPPEGNVRVYEACDVVGRSRRLREFFVHSSRRR
jgi:hypothetical protein